MKTEEIILGDGQKYIMSELNVGDLVEIEEKFGTAEMGKTNTKSMIYWLYLALKKKHKDITIEKLYELIPLSFSNSASMVKIMDAFVRLSGGDKLPKNDVSPVKE